MALTYADIIKYAKISQYLSADEIANGTLFGAAPDTDLPEKLYIERKSVEWLYNIDPTNATLFATTQYLLALCGKYATLAPSVSGAGGTVSPIISPIVNPSTNPYLIQISSADFTGATNYNNPLISGKTVKVFDNDINRFLYYPSEFINTATGINILLPGFDAQAYSYSFIIFIVS